ncbi:hypothetical protein AUJ68_02180 [Candidatus Woesearchaeota archaeon CG1_02_57_44]|nr:MAG: hypothetical protein AUJ68_02180 [Candidatus Woesearchaeota archaeon CG1_02_57_44]
MLVILAAVMSIGSLMPAVFAAEDFVAYANGQAITSCQCKTYASVITVQNTGTVASAYNLYLEGDAAPYAAIRPQTFILGPDQQQKATAYITPPCTFAGNLQLRTIVATSTLDKEINQDIVVQNCRNLELSVDRSSITACSGTTMTYGLLISNPGPFEETYVLNATALNPSFAANPVALQPGTSTVVPMQVATPEGFTGVVKFAASAYAVKSGQLQAVDLTAYANDCYQYTALVQPQSIKACADESSAARVDIINNGTLANVYTAVPSLTYVIGSSEYVPAGKQASISLILSPKREDIGNHTLNVQVQTEKGKSQSLTVPLEVLDCYGLRFEAQPYAAVACCGQQDYAGVVRNTGSVSETVKVSAYDDFVSVIPAVFSLGPGKEQQVIFHANLPCDTQQRVISGEANLLGYRSSLVKGISFPVKVLDDAACFAPTVTPKDVAVDYATRSFDINVAAPGIRESNYTIALEPGQFWQAQVQDKRLSGQASGQDHTVSDAATAAAGSQAASGSYSFFITPTNESAQGLYPAMLTLYAGGNAYPASVNVALRHDYVHEGMVAAWLAIKPYLLWLVLLLLLLLVFIILLRRRSAARRKRTVQALTLADEQATLELTRKGWMAGASWRSVPESGASAGLTHPYFEIVRIEVVPKKTLRNVRLEIHKLLERPKVPAVDKGIAYFDIKKKNCADRDIAFARVTFRVSSAMLKASGLKSRDVALLRYRRTWEPLHTRHVVSSGGYAYFEAVTPGFSVFAIGRRQSNTPFTRKAAASDLVPAAVARGKPAQKGSKMSSKEQAKQRFPWGFLIAILLILLLVAYWQPLVARFGPEHPSAVFTDASTIMLCEAGPELAALHFNHTTASVYDVRMKGPSYLNATALPGQVVLTASGPRALGRSTAGITVTAGDELVAKTTVPVKVRSCFAASLSSVKDMDCCGLKTYELNLSNNAVEPGTFSLFASDGLVLDQSEYWLAAGDSVLVPVTADVPCDATLDGMVRATRAASPLPAIEAKVQVQGIATKACYAAEITQERSTVSTKGGIIPFTIRNVGIKEARYGLFSPDAQYPVDFNATHVTLAPGQSERLDIIIAPSEESTQNFTIGALFLGNSYLHPMTVSIRQNVFSKSMDAATGFFYPDRMPWLWALLIVLFIIWVLLLIRNRRSSQVRQHFYQMGDEAEEATAKLPTVRKVGQAYAYEHWVMRIHSPTFAIRKITLLTNANAKRVEARLTRLPATEVNVKDTYHAYRLRLDGANKQDTERIDVWFRVEKAWVKKHGVILLARPQRTWQRIKPKVLGKDDGYVYYQTQIPSAGTLVIAGKSASTLADVADAKTAAKGAARGTGAAAGATSAKAQRVEKQTGKRTPKAPSRGREVLFTLFLLFIVLLIAYAITQGATDGEGLGENATSPMTFAHSSDAAGIADDNATAATTSGVTGGQDGAVTGADSSDMSDITISPIIIPKAPEASETIMVQNETQAAQGPSARELAEAEVAAMLSYIRDNNLSDSFYYHVWPEGYAYTINLSANIIDPDHGRLNFTVTPMDDVASTVRGDFATFVPPPGFVGVRTVKVFAIGQGKQALTPDITLIVRPATWVEAAKVNGTAVLVLVIVLTGIMLMVAHSKKRR